MSDGDQSGQSNNPLAAVGRRSNLRQLRSEVAEFLETSPLYTKSEISVIPGKGERWVAESLELECATCEISRPFHIKFTNSHEYGIPHVDPSVAEHEEAPAPNGVWFLEYQCKGCSNFKYMFLTHFAPSEGWIRKVGQIPPWSIDVSNDTAKALGREDADLYRKARLFMSQGYGIAACAYLRRLIENQIDPILSQMTQTLKEEGAGDDMLSEIEDVAKSHHVSDKLKTVSKVAPKSLHIEGMNPLNTIYTLYSDGVHNRSEDECKQIAMKLAAATEYVVAELNRAAEARERYMQAMKDLE